MNARLRPFALLASVILLLPFSAALTAGGDHDHDRARRALEAGEILPLGTIIHRLERTYPGQIIEVELERDDGVWVYEIKLLRDNGSLLKLKVDARDAALLGVKGRDLRPAPGEQR